MESPWSLWVLVQTTVLLQNLSIKSQMPHAQILPPKHPPFVFPLTSKFLIKDPVSMAIFIMTMAAVLVAILVISLTVEQQKDPEAENVEIQEFDLNNKSTRKESTITIAESAISEAHSDQLINLPSTAPSQLPQNLEELGKTTDHQLLTLFPRLSSYSQMAPILQTLRAEAQAAILKSGLRIACLVISVSTTGIISLVGFPGNQLSARNKCLFKAVIISMSASLLSALILLILSTINLNFSSLIQTVRIITWFSTAVMTLGIILLISFYFHIA